MEDRIIRTEYSEIMQKSFIDYAMSVIVARALPDIRDGLKPVQRRTLYDMYELGIRYDRPYRKSARIVGDTMGKYHPHGDSSIYDCLVVMTQDFKKAIPLVDGHGNFGNIEGDGAAAMRYTEARLSKITQENFLEDLDKNVVDFLPNFDETEKEPSVLPVKIPNFLINGSEGIAVGMATSTPPHNLAEVIDAEIAYIQDDTLTTKDLMKYIKGPDFPTGGIVINKDDLREIYETGVGKIRIRGKVETEKGKNGHINLVITEIPYTMIGMGIGKFMADVAELAEKKITNDIIDISNQSSKEGIRIVIELKKDTDIENFTNLLYKKTKLEDTFGVNMLAIDNGRPETMSLKEIMRACADFQFEVATRKYTTLLKKEQDKKEIQEGLIKACNVIDLVIEVLRGSKDRAMAKNCLVNGVTDGINFKSRESQAMAAQLLFTEAQADAILEMRLYKLIGLELDALVKEHEQTVANIYRYEDILESHDSMSMVIQNELLKIKKEYQAQRKTVIDNRETAVYEEKPVEEMDVAFIMDKFGYAKTIDATTYEKNKETIEAEFKFSFIMKNTGKVCFFTNTGNLHTVKAMDLPQGKMRDKGVPIDNVSNFDTSKETIVLAASQSDLNLYRLLFTTKMSMMKIVDGGEFDVSKRTVAATKLSDGDEVVNVEILHTQKTVILQSNEGYFLRFYVEQVPEKKKAAVGVRGMRLGKNDFVRDVYYLNDMEEKSIEHNDKELHLGHLKVTSRDTKGTKVRL
ncbi:DNA gyrase subunit A [Butyrivibrio hungatei DSM 14810]|uniref:DNA topoisomerase (ATP-hydrolyzing) n=1 Tax=Butyrivibrio hungatei DSM 14810 TaxID=1121132 RepID=A0A1M7SYR4_9FIRM|nr:DNA topoisomerase (ATP-hydrolyzing) [Butyrivibrio hungatei]SHN63586.1 DNA gyrase subunit A [Butyrivibrio hungatei DSM 14810]